MLYFFSKHLFTVSERSCRNVVAFLFNKSTAFSRPDIRYLHGTSNPYPPPRLIPFPVTLVSKNGPGRVKNKEIHGDMTYDFIFVHHCNCITVLLISAFACAAIRLSFGSGSDMLMHFVSSNKRIKFIRAEACVNWNFFLDIFQLKIANFVVLCHFCFRYFFLGFASFIGSLIQKPDYYLLRRCDEICEKLRSSLVGYNRALFFVFSSKIM